MNGLKYRWILYFISGVILATLCIQVYWNFKNYHIGKQQLINDVQTSLDNAVDGYYTKLAKQHTFGFISESMGSDELIMDVRINDKRHLSDTTSEKIRQMIIGDSADLNRISMSNRIGNDSIKLEFSDSLPVKWKNQFQLHKAIDPSIIEVLTSKIVLTFQEDSLSLKKIDSLLANELQRKNIAIDYGLTYTNPISEKNELRSDIIKASKLATSSKSPYFLDKSSLKIHFSNITETILKKNIFGIFLSFLLVAAVIGCLLYLLGIIKHQKQLAEVKNDLISNITHEFKTPIATIGAAMEGIQTFNTSNDTEKNIRYAKISSEQVEKLNGMVEKLLETATLDSEKLSLNFEEINLVELLRKASIKEAFALENKTITFEASLNEINYEIDVFHFENAINNIIDNAIKYGGDKITVAIQKRTNEIEILISDSGSELSEEHKKHIFEKFYRVPKGNTHNVKGFGIGLYYSKKIIEKHKGTITLEQNHLTSFKISLPNV